MIMNVNLMSYKIDLHIHSNHSDSSFDPKEIIDEAAKKNSEADKNVEMAKSNLNKSKKEAIRLIEDAKKEAEKQSDILLDETKKELMQKRQEASEDIRKEQEKAIKQVHDDVVDLAYETSKTILKREVNTKDDQKLIDDFVSDLIEKR